MKPYILFVPLFLLCWASNAQVQYMSGNLSIGSLPTNNGDSTFTVTGTYNDPKGLSFAGDVDTNWVMWKGNHLFPVDTITSAPGANPITFVVADPTPVGFISAGTASLLQQLPNGTLAMPPAGDSDPSLATPPDYSAIQSYNLGVLAGGSTNIPEHQNILYVSKDGDDNTGERNNPSKPFATPWGAKLAALPRDLVYIYGGEYTSGTTTTGADFISDGIDLEATSLMADSVTFFLSTNALIKNLGSVTLPFFYDTIGQYTAVIGPGHIINPDSRATIAHIDHPNSHLQIDVGKIVNGEFDAGWQFGFKLFNFKTFDVKAKETVVTHSRFLHPHGSDTLRHAKFSYITDRAIEKHGDAFFWSRAELTVDSSTFYIEIGEWDCDSMRYEELAFSSKYYDSQVTVNIGKGDFFSTSTREMYGGFSEREKVNSSLVVNCGNCNYRGMSNMADLRTAAQTASENSLMAFRGNYQHNGVENNGNIGLIAVNGARTDGVEVKFDGNFYSSSVPLTIGQPIDNLTLSGKFASFKDTCVIRYNTLSNGVKLQNVVLENAGGDTLITSSSPVNIKTSGAYAGLNDLFGYNVTFEKQQELGALKGLPKSEWSEVFTDTISLFYSFIETPKGATGIKRSHSFWDGRTYQISENAQSGRVETAYKGIGIQHDYNIAGGTIDAPKQNTGGETIYRSRYKPFDGVVSRLGGEFLVIVEDTVKSPSAVPIRMEWYVKDDETGSSYPKLVVSSKNNVGIQTSFATGYYFPDVMPSADSSFQIFNTDGTSVWLPKTGIEDIAAQAAQSQADTLTAGPTITITPTTPTSTIDLQSKQFRHIVLDLQSATANTTIDFSNPRFSGHYTIAVINDGGKQLAFSASKKLDGAAYSETLSGEVLLEVIYDSQDSKYLVVPN